MIKIYFNEERSKIFDFLFSFVKYEIVEIEKIDKIFGNLIDNTYLRLINEYRENMENKYKNIYKFLDQDFNILVLIFINSKGENFNEFYEYLNKISSDDIKKIIKKNYELEEELTVENVNELSLSDSSKWKLIYAYNNYDKFRDFLLEEVKLAYEDYNRLYNLISSNYKDDIDKLIEQIESGKYKKILRSQLSENIINKTYSEYFIFLVSIYLVYIYDKNGNKCMGFGLYSIKYFEELEKNRNINPEELKGVLKSLSDPTRYNILKSIRRGINSNKVLADLYDITPAGITYQLNNLQENNLIRYEDSSKKYIVNIDLIERVLNNIRLDFSINNGMK